MSTLADKMKELRGKVPRRYFAEQLGISEGSLVKYESGERVPNADTIGVICTKMGVSSDWLLFGEGPTPDVIQKLPTSEARLLQPIENAKNIISKSTDAGKLDINKQKALHALGKRLRELRGGEKRSDFAYGYLVAPTSLARWEAGESQPDLGFLVRLATSIGVTLEWLVTGQGEARPKGRLEGDEQLAYLDRMDIFASAKIGDSPECLSQCIENTVSDQIETGAVAGFPPSERVVSAPRHETLACGNTEIVMIPMVEARLSAGNGSFETDAAHDRRYAFRGDFLRRKGQINQMVLMRVDGDSMEPQIESGDVVLIDQSQTSLFPGKMYAVGVEDMVFLKIVSAEPGKVVLHSLNSELYPPLEIDTRSDMAQAVRIVGRCVWSCREM